MTPRLSVLMPTYNRTAWLTGALDSVLAPGLDLELLVLDNGSRDGTWALLEERAARDPRLRILRWELNDPGDAFPFLLEMARGEYVNFFADDDAMLPGGLARKMEFLDAHPAIGLVFSAVRCMDGEGRDLGEGAWTVIAPEDVPDREDLFESLILGNFVPMPAAMFRRALSPTGRILRDPTLSPSHDWQFWLDLARRTRCAFLREPTVCLRMHGDQVTVTHGVKQGKFIDVNLRVWRSWMLEADPPFIPSARVWGAMTRTLAGALEATHGQAREKILDGMARLQAIREEQDARLGHGPDSGAAPEVFLVDLAEGDGAAFVRAFRAAFVPEEPVALVLLRDPSGPPPDALEALVAGEGAVIRILEPGGLLGVLRDYPHFQWLSGAPDRLEGVWGARLSRALEAGVKP